jgi:hypothetical protein
LRARAGARIMRAREAEWPADQVERWLLTKLIPYARAMLALIPPNK